MEHLLTSIRTLERTSLLVCSVMSTRFSSHTSTTCPSFLHNGRIFQPQSLLRKFFELFCSVVYVQELTPDSPMQFHIFALATFASLIAPFGGFFASGLKRTFNIKDFGDSIPGHGGMTDRMDCQFIMGFFTFVYYQR